MNTIQNNSGINFNAKLKVQDSEKLLSKDVISKYTKKLKDYGNKNDEVFISASSDKRKNLGNSDKFLEGNIKVDDTVVKTFGEKVSEVSESIDEIFGKIISHTVEPFFKK